jgi:hypothetical protein
MQARVRARAKEARDDQQTYSAKRKAGGALHGSQRQR